MEVSNQNLPADVYTGEIPTSFGVASAGDMRLIGAQAGGLGVPNSLEISSRRLGDTESPIMAPGHVLQAGDIVLARARTIAMHAIITLGQIYKYHWDTENSFRFWSHPAMIVAVAGQPLRSADGTKVGTVTDNVLVQATINPKGVNYGLLSDFKRDYSSRCWIFSPVLFETSTRSKVVEHAEIESGMGLFEWLEGKGLLKDISEVPSAKQSNGNRRQDARQFTYGLLSLASVLSCQVFQQWRFRFFNEGQVTCSGFIAELMEKGNYVFPSEIHAFPGDVAEQLYDDFPEHRALKVKALAEHDKGKSKDWTKGVANLRKQISDDKKVALKNAGTFRLSAGRQKLYCPWPPSPARSGGQSRLGFGRMCKTGRC